MTDIESCGSTDDCKPFVVNKILPPHQIQTPENQHLLNYTIARNPECSSTISGIDSHPQFNSHGTTQFHQNFEMPYLHPSFSNHIPEGREEHLNLSARHGNNYNNALSPPPPHSSQYFEQFQYQHMNPDASFLYPHYKFQHNNDSIRDHNHFHGHNVLSNGHHSHIVDKLRQVDFQKDMMHNHNQNHHEVSSLHLETLSNLEPTEYERHTQSRKFNHSATGKCGLSFLKSVPEEENAAYLPSAQQNQRSDPLVTAESTVTSSVSVESTSLKSERLTSEPPESKTQKEFSKLEKGKELTSLEDDNSVVQRPIQNSTTTTISSIDKEIGDKLQSEKIKNTLEVQPLKDKVEDVQSTDRKSDSKITRSNPSDKYAVENSESGLLLPSKYKMKPNLRPNQLMFSNTSPLPSNDPEFSEGKFSIIHLSGNLNEF